MRIRDWILVSLLFVWLLVAVIVWIKQSKRGCTGCDKKCDYSTREGCAFKKKNVK